MMRKRFAPEVFRIGSSDLCLLASLISSCSQRRLVSVGGGRESSSALLLAPHVDIVGVHEDAFKEGSTAANTSTTKKRSGGKGRGKNPVDANSKRVPVPDFLKRRGFDHLLSKQLSTPSGGGNSNNDSPSSHEDEQTQRAKKLREFVLGCARANNNPKKSASGGGGVGGGSTVTQRIIETNEVVFASEDPLQEVLKQVSRNKEETVQTQKEMRKLVLSGCANMIRKLRVEHVLSHEQVASESSSFTRGQRGNGTARHHTKSGVGRKNIGKMELKRHIFNSYVFEHQATSPRIPTLRAQQAEREHVLREQLLPIAASLAQKAFVSAKEKQHKMQNRTDEEEGNNGGEEEEESGIHNAGRGGDGVEEWTDGEEMDFMHSLDDGPLEGGSRIHSAPHTTASTFTTASSSPHGGGASASASPWAKIRGSTASTTAHAEAEEKTFLPPPEMELPSFEQLGMLLRAVAECGLGGEDSVIGPLMRCLKLRLELREEARERAREAMTAAEMEEDEMKKAASQHQRASDNGPHHSSASTFTTAKNTARNTAKNTASGSPSTASRNPSKGEKDTANTTDSLSPPVTYELNEDGLWDLMMCDDSVAAETPSVNNNRSSEATSQNLGAEKHMSEPTDNTTHSSTTHSSSSAKARATEMNDQTHHDAGKSDKPGGDTALSSSSTAPLHPRVVAELLSSCASLGAMEEAMLIALLETDVEPFYRRNFGAASLVLTMEALGRFGYHKDKEALFTKMGKSLAVQLKPLVVPRHLEANVLELGKRLAKLKSHHKHSRVKNTAKENTRGGVEGNTQKEDGSSSPGSSASKSGNGQVGQNKTSERRTQRAIVKLQKRYNSALKAFREARRQRARTYLSIPTRFALSLLRYIAESPIRHPAIVHRLVDVILLKSRHQTAMLITACRGDGGARGGAFIKESNKKANNRDKHKNNSGTADKAIIRQAGGRAINKRSVLDHPLVARHRKAICHDALESTMVRNGLDTARGLTAEARVNHLLDREEEEEAMRRGSNHGRSRLGYPEDDEFDGSTRRKGNTTHSNSTSAAPTPLINTLTPEQLRDLSQLLNLMGTPYPKIDKEFMSYIMEREHGALLRRHDRDDDFKPSRHGDEESDNPQNADGTMDWVRAEAVFGGNLTK